MASQMIEEGKRYLVRCEHCHGEYHVRPDDYAASHLKKEIQIDLPGKASDYSYAKRFFCPHCDQKHFAEIIRLEEVVR